MHMSRTGHGNQRHPSISTILYDYKPLWVITSAILYIFEMDLLLVLLSCDSPLHLVRTLKYYEDDATRRPDRGTSI